MPTILVKIPNGSYPGESRKALMRAITDVAIEVEQIGDAPQQQAVTWVAVDELAPGAITAGGNDISDRVMTCVVQAYIPSGVLTGATRKTYVKKLNTAFNSCIPVGDKRVAIVSALLLEMPEGQWGAGDVIWRLPEVTAAAGFKHLQSIIAS